MAYKSVKKQRQYMLRWRRKHPTYMRDYYQRVVRTLRPGRPRTIPIS